MEPPASTYRLQLSPRFTFADARAVVPYLDRLGVGAVYLSPVFEARAGSDHGYDVTDPTRIRAELGGPAGLEALAREVIGRGMGVLIDIVPNHMAASEDNPWWWDVLARGPGSEHARAFDVDWEAGDGKVILPVLGDGAPDGLRLEDGELRYHDRRFPVSGPADGDLTDVLERQHYRLTCWRDPERNYRRFFDIDDLVAVRQEDPAVFEASHRLVFDLVERGLVTGLRVDHIDGLTDPEAYLDRLPPVYVVVEKILGPREQLPDTWRCAGTTGYGFANAAAAFFADREGAEAIRTANRARLGTGARFAEIARDAKREVLGSLFASDVDRLARRVAPLTGLAPDDARTALIELTAGLDVYRTYIRAAPVRDEDRERIAAAAERAGSRTVEPLVSILLDPSTAERLRVAQRWQQLSGAVMAKGVEDTALYRYPLLLSRNDVGDEPDDPAIGAAELHDRLRRRRPGLNAGSTHDSKRSEDARARIDALTRHPGAWTRLLETWAGRTGPAPDEELYLLQTLVAVWPVTSERLREHLRKAAREAKRRTSWHDPSEEHERALDAAADHLVEAAAPDVRRVVDEIEADAVAASVGQIVLRAIAPGVPDVYQGAELWHRRLTDPDNRAPVDFALRERLLDTDEDPDALKLRVLRASLHARRSDPELFAHGAAVPVAAPPGVFALARRLGGRWALGVVGRGDGDLDLPEGAPPRWSDVLTGAGHDAPLEVSVVLRTLPAALLVG